MAQLIVTICDLCDEQTAGEPVVVAFGKSAPRVLDLCASHHEDLVAPLEIVLGEHGRKMPANPTLPPAPTEGEPFPCIVCDFESVTSTALSQHQRHRHAMRSTGAVYGTPSRCYLCAAEFGDGHGLAGHARVHEVEGSHGIYRAALSAGDPHDLIAKRKAELGINA